MFNVESFIAWANERGITNQKPDINGFVRAIVEEIGEAIESSDTHDDYGVIDAMGDVVVFCVTEMGKYGVDNFESINKLVNAVFNYDGDINLREFTESWVIDCTYKLSMYINEKSIENIEDILRYTIIKMKYITRGNVSCVLNEILKEISSRKGSWNEKEGKWIKDTSEEAKKLWYKADFTKCIVSV